MSWTVVWRARVVEEGIGEVGHVGGIGTHEDPVDSRTGFTKLRSDYCGYDLKGECVGSAGRRCSGWTNALNRVAKLDDAEARASPLRIERTSQHDGNLFSLRYTTSRWFINSI